YVEVLRNLPLAVQLFTWYVLFTENFPSAREAYNPLPNVFLSQRGLMFPVFADNPAHPWIAAAFLIGVVATFFVARWGKQRQAQTGQPFPIGWASLALIVGLPLVVFLISGAPSELDKPVLRGFNFSGGVTLPPEFVALLI